MLLEYRPSEFKGPRRGDVHETYKSTHRPRLKNADSCVWRMEKDGAKRQRGGERGGREKGVLIHITRVVF